MEVKHVKLIYFSATGTTQKVLESIAEGIAVMATISFTVSQLIAVAERNRTGIRRAAGGRIRPGKCFSVIMIGRLDDYVREVAGDNGAGVTESDIRQAGLAVTKQACRVYRDRGYESVILVAALRGTYHLTELAGVVSGMGAEKVSLLGYHEWGKPKYEALGREYPCDELEALPKARLEAMKDVLEARGIDVTIDR